MKQRRRLLGLLALVLAVPAVYAQTAPADPADPVDAASVQALMDMGAHLQTLKAFASAPN